MKYIKNKYNINNYTNMFRITKRLFFLLGNMENFNIEKKHLLSLIEQQYIGINTQLTKTNCNVDKNLLLHEIDELNKIKNKINMNLISQDEIRQKRDEFSEKYTNYLNKIQYK
jgi:hypothetical protein